MTGFYAKVTMRHESLMPGQIVFMKAVAHKYSTPTLYAILDRRTGVETGDEVDANTFRNQFVVVSRDAVL